MQSVQLLHEVLTEGFRFSLKRKRNLFLGSRSELSFDACQDDMHPGLALLRLLAANGTARLELGKVVVPHSTIALLVPSEIKTLGLPGACPYWLRLDARGSFSDPMFSVRTTWINRAGAAIAGLHRIGVSIGTVVDQYTVREPLFSLLEEIDRLNSLGENNDRE